MLKKRILIFYDHFYPAWKAGGPVQSLVNLVRQLNNEYSFYIVCKPHEMNSDERLTNISINQWTNWEGKAEVFYSSYGLGATYYQQVTKILNDVKPDVLFVNGLFSPYFNLVPLSCGFSYAKKHPACKIVWSARGMLHPGALSQKPFKKRLFLRVIQLLNWHKKVHWHVTDEQECRYVSDTFGNNMQVTVAGNFPNLLSKAETEQKQEGILKLGTIALISPMKNHLLVLQSLQRISASIEWHIFGPVKDEIYWRACEEEIVKLPEKTAVVYHGECVPADLPEAMKKFQVFIMPSKSENFGHAILEALSAGKPVITTNTTPFKNLQSYKAGYTVSPDRTDELAAAIVFFAGMKEEEFHLYSSNAVSFAAGFSNLSAVQNQYRHLFN
ncbi:MAG: glycosyltransferase family 4 protein [Lacibacter sp.]